MDWSRILNIVLWHQGRARDLSVWDRDETETLGILSEKRLRRDVEGPRWDRDVSVTETLAETYGENH